MQHTKSGRLEYLDTAKGIGILLVAAVHACSNQSTVVETQCADIIRFASLFVMPMFFFINGILYNPKYSKNPVSGIWKKFKAYYIPFVSYNLLFWLFHNVFAKFHLISGELDSKDYAYTSVRTWVVTFLKTVLGFRQKFAGAMWFLETLIVISFVFILLDYFATKWFKEKRMLVLAIGVAIVVIINRIFNLITFPYMLSSIMHMIYCGLNGLLFFFLGYIFQTYQWNAKLESKKNWLTVVLFAVLIVTVILMRPQVISVISNQSIPVYKYGIGAFIGNEEATGMSLLKFIVFSVICLAGMVMTLLFSQIKFVANSKVLKLLGQYSLHIMCLHFFAFKAVSFIIILIYQLPIERLAEYPVVRDVNGIWWLVYVVAGCAISILLAKIYEKGKGVLTAYIGNRKNKKYN